MIGTITNKGRPLRFAFFVDPNDKKTLRQIIQINTCLLGGKYNPIIPLLAPRSRKYHDVVERTTGRKWILGMIEAFDPDFLVYDGDLPTYISDLEIKKISLKEVVPNLNPKIQEKQYGISTFELLNTIYEKWFQDVNFGATLIIPSCKNKNQELFWASYLGEFPPQLNNTILTLNKSLRSKKVDTQQIDEIFREKAVYPLTLSKFNLSIFKDWYSTEDKIVFLLDESNLFDIVEFWNLRATGRSVLPLSKFLVKDARYQIIVSNYINNSPMTNKYGSFEFQVNIIKSSSIKNIDTEDWVDIVNKTQGNIRTIHEYYPRFHTKWGRIHCREGVGNVYFRKTKNTDIEKAESILVPICKPSGYTSNISNQLKYINELSYSIYDFSCKYAAVLPKETIQKANLFISRIGSRMGKNGLNVSFGKISTNSYRDSIYFSLPIATDIFGEWLKEKGWSYELSAPGRLSTELYNQIDGWFYAFERKDLLELLETMSKQSSHEGKGERIGTIDSKLKEVFKKDHIDYRKIFDLPVFATGLNLKCPKCGRFSWYSLTELSDGVTCKKCLSQFNSAKPIRSNKKNHWAYKIIGPLSVPGYADGAFSVISAINFFNQKFVGHMPMTATYSFETKNKTSGEKIEIDYAFLAGSDTFGNTFSDVVFGEAKSFNDFQKSDFAKMKLLMKSFPGAFIVFSTLKDKLTKQEIKELVKLTKIGNKYWENNRPINPLIVLTGNELLSPFGPPICWEKDAYKTTQERCGTLLELANATQRRYLGIGSWEEDWIKKFEAKRKKLDQE